MHVTIVGRNAQAGAQIVEEMKASAPAANFDFLQLDSSLLKNASVLAEHAARNPAPLDYLVLTAGIATTQGYTPTSEGLDQKLATHYFGRMKIATTLLPYLPLILSSIRYIAIMSSVCCGCNQDDARGP